MDCTRQCVLCGELFETWKCYDKRKNGNKYCSQRCCKTAQRKNKVIEEFDDVFYKNSKGYFYSQKTKRFYHKVIYEKYHNIVVEKGFSVHHIDKNCTNNSIENLQLVSNTEHGIIHYPDCLQKINIKKPFNKCVIDCCFEKVKGHGLCNKHYQRFYQNRKKETRDGYKFYDAVRELIR